MTLARSALASALVIVAVAPSARADEATARILYDQAEALAKQQKWPEACPLYEASYKADAKLGVLLHLADCHERVGLTATAWSEWNDAVELAHRQNDTREAVAKKRADALTPKLARLRIVRPKTAVPGLVVRRDGADVTVLVGSDMPIDPGEHDIAVSAPGYVDAHVKVKIDAQPKTTPLELPALVAEQKPVEPIKPDGTKPAAPRDGSLAIVTQPDAEIALDGTVVGDHGRFDGKVKPGRHVLRVSAAGMHPYQTEIVVLEGENRSFDVPALERESIGGGVMVPAAPRGPGWELGAGLSIGDKMHGDSPVVVATRIDLAKRINRRVRFGVYFEAAGIDSNGSCGTEIPGPTPSTPFDYGTRNQFNKCYYVMGGIELYVHILPDRKWDPWVAFTPGFRDTSVKFTPYDASGAPMQQISGDLLGITATLRAGVDYHLSRNFTIGPLLEAQLWIVSDEVLKSMRSGSSSQYVSLLAGVRTAVGF